MGAKPLDGRIALVTGGSRGIGRGIALALARAGADVAVNYRREADEAEKVVAEIRTMGRKAQAYAAAVDDFDSCATMVDAVAADFGGISILINNAGTSATGEFESVTDKDWQADFDLKLFAAIRLSRLAIPEMRKNKWGRIINVTNIGAKQPRAKSMPTTVTRAAGLAMTKALSKEFAADNILVNSVCIGLIRAGQHERKAAKAGIPVEELYEKQGKEVPLGRVGRAEEVANVVAFFSSEASSYVTGSSVNLDGGTSAVM